MLNCEWQVIQSILSGNQPQALHGSHGEGTTLINQFEVIPADRTWRYAPLPKPKVDGPQSAIVTGPKGKEIFCDEHGRVRVKFHWDRYHGMTEESSCWIRVSQAWAGPGFGNLAIPRVGQEVIVDFLNGDPEKKMKTLEGAAGPEVVVVMSQMTMRMNLKNIVISFILLMMQVYRIQKPATLPFLKTIRRFAVKRTRTGIRKYSPLTVSR